MAYMDEQGFIPGNSEDEKDLYREVLAVKNGAQKRSQNRVFLRLIFFDIKKK